MLLHPTWSSYNISLSWTHVKLALALQKYKLIFSPNLMIVRLVRAWFVAEASDWWGQWYKANVSDLHFYIGYMLFWHVALCQKNCSTCCKLMCVLLETHGHATRYNDFGCLLQLLCSKCKCFLCFCVVLQTPSLTYIHAMFFSCRFVMTNGSLLHTYKKYLHGCIWNVGMLCCMYFDIPQDKFCYDAASI
jgi:hypothetical protein